ncbi:hypothetical protein ACFKP0_25040, partial [Salmonella enterica subsp. enterica serovar Soahanina]
HFEFKCLSKTLNEQDIRLEKLESLGNSDSEFIEAAMMNVRNSTFKLLRIRFSSLNFSGKESSLKIVHHSLACKKKLAIANCCKAQKTL